MLFNILQSTGQSPWPRTTWPQMPTVLPLTDPRPGAEVTWTLKAMPVHMSWPLSFVSWHQTCSSLFFQIPELSLHEAHLCSASWFHARLRHGQGVLEGVCKAGDVGKGLAPASWFAVPDCHLTTGLCPSTWLVPGVTTSGPQLCSVHPQRASRCPFTGLRPPAQHPVRGIIL